MSTYLALDVGDRFIGIAYAQDDRIAVRHSTIDRSEIDTWQALTELVKNQTPDIVVIGLPRNLEGEETAQSAAIRKFTDELRDRLKCNVAFFDETLTSKLAEKNLATTGEPRQLVHSEAARLILSDYLRALRK